VKPEDRADLIDDLVARLRVEGAPSGTWLVDIAHVRKSLRGADDLLRRLQVAIVRQAEFGGDDA